MIARLRLDRERSVFLSNFIDTYLQLNEQEEKQFRAEVEKLPKPEKEKSMELMGSWERMGWERGLQRECELVLRQLEHRIGNISQRAMATIKRLPVEQVENLGLALLDFKNARDLTQWLRAQANSATNGHSSTTKPASKRKAA